MTRTAKLIRTIRTQWGEFTPGCIVKVVAADNEKAIIDFGIGAITSDGYELHMYSVINSRSIAIFRQLPEVA